MIIFSSSKMSSGSEANRNNFDISREVIELPVVFGPFLVILPVFRRLFLIFSGSTRSSSARSLQATIHTSGHAPLALYQRRCWKQKVIVFIVFVTITY